MTEPTFPEKSYNFVKDGIIYIHDYFDCSISSEIIPNFKLLIAQNQKLKNGKIIIDICSNGGEVDILAELLALVECAKSQGIIIETRAMSRAHSCGALLLMSGTPGHRYGSPLSYVLIHHALHWDCHRTDMQLDRVYDKSKHLNDNLERIIKKYSKIPSSKINEMLKDDNYYVYGKDLLKFGIVDHLTYTL